MQLRKLIKVFSNIKEITEGIKNNIFKSEDVEAVAKLRWHNCKICKHIDQIGDSCDAPGTQPCCAECGCSLQWKLRSLSSKCPIDRWDALMPEELEEELKEKMGYEDAEVEN